MPQILPTKSIYYHNVNLIACPGIVKSRTDIPKRLYLIFSSPMSAIAGPKFVKTALELGLSVSLHRFCTIGEEIKLFKDNYDYSLRIWAAIGLNDYDRVMELYVAGCRNFIIDTANGYLKTVVDFIDELYYSDINKNQVLNLMVGNLHSNIGVNLYSKIPNINLRINIGSGSACKTAVMTSVGRGQVSELIECYNDRNGSQILVADGGISKPAYAALAFACGADKILLGGYFSKAEEASNIQKGEYKFWGSSSYKQLELSGNKRSHSEGAELNIDTNEIKPLKVLVDELWGGIASATSYCGFSSLEDMIGNGTIEIKHS